MPKAFSARATALQTDVLLNRYRVQVASDASVIEAAMVATINANRGARAANAQDDGFPIASDDNSITIGAFTAALDDGTFFAFPAGSLTALASGTNFSIFHDPDTGDYLVDDVKPSPLWLDAAKIFLSTYSTSAAGVFPAVATPPPGYTGGGPREVAGG